MLALLALPWSRRDPSGQSVSSGGESLRPAGLKVRAPVKASVAALWSTCALQQREEVSWVRTLETTSPAVCCQGRGQTLLPDAGTVGGAPWLAQPLTERLRGHSSAG